MPKGLRIEYEKLSTARNMSTSRSQTESAEHHPLEAPTQALPGFCHMALETPPPAHSGPKDQSNGGFASTTEKIRPLEALKNVCQQLCPWRGHGDISSHVGGRLPWLPRLHFVCADVFMSDLDHHTFLHFSPFSFPTH